MRASYPLRTWGNRAVASVLTRPGASHNDEPPTEDQRSLIAGP